MTTLGVAFDGMAPVATAVQIARRAEQSGLESMWIAEHLGYRESTLAAISVLEYTRTLRVIPTAVSPYLRHPMLLAMAVATLAEHGKDRVSVALGIGNPLFLDESGVTPSRPIAWSRDYIACLRQLFSGEPAYYEGAIFSLRGARLSLDTPIDIPIYLAAMGPQMLKLAGEMADGVVLSSGLSPRSTVQSLAVVHAAAMARDRTADDVRSAGYVITAVSRDGKSAIEACRAKLAFVLRNKHLADSIQESGLSVDQDAIIAAVSRRDFEAAQRLVSDDAVEAFTISGTPVACRERLGEYAQAGLGEVVLSLTGPAARYPLALALVRDMDSGSSG